MLENCFKIVWDCNLCKIRFPQVRSFEPLYLYIAPTKLTLLLQHTPILYKLNFMSVKVSNNRKCDSVVNMRIYHKSSQNRYFVIIYCQDVNTIGKSGFYFPPRFFRFDTIEWIALPHQEAIRCHHVCGADWVKTAGSLSQGALVNQLGLKDNPTASWSLLLGLAFISRFFLTESGLKQVPSGDRSQSNCGVKQTLQLCGKMQTNQSKLSSTTGSC